MIKCVNRTSIMSVFNKLKKVFLRDIVCVKGKEREDI